MDFSFNPSPPIFWNFVWKSMCVQHILIICGEFNIPVFCGHLCKLFAFTFVVCLKLFYLMSFTLASTSCLLEVCKNFFHLSFELFSIHFVLHGWNVASPYCILNTVWRVWGCIWTDFVWRGRIILSFTYIYPPIVSVWGGYVCTYYHCEKCSNSDTYSHAYLNKLCCICEVCFNIFILTLCVIEPTFCEVCFHLSIYFMCGWTKFV